jgi:hypothetical protein
MLRSCSIEFGWSSLQISCLSECAAVRGTSWIGSLIIDGSLVDPIEKLAKMLNRPRLCENAHEPTAEADLESKWPCGCFAGWKLPKEPIWF